MNTLSVLMAALMLGAPMTEDEIVNQADARIAGCRMGEVVLKVVGPDGKPVAAGTELDIEQTRHAFLFGCNIFKLGHCRTPEHNAAYEKHFAELLNYATLPFYWWGYETDRGKPDDKRTQELADWCRDHGVTTKGHPLAWNWVDPKWLPEEPERAMKAQLARIGKCVTRFRNEIALWDVVNEATHWDRPDCKKNAPKLTQAIADMGVAEYVRQAFMAARQANPDARLVINDYRTDPEFADKIISQLVDSDRKPLYDIIGIQSHQHGGPWPVTRIWEVCERHAVFGKPLHFTETTFVSGEEGWELPAKKEGDFKWTSTPGGEKRQAEQAARFYTVLFSHPAVEAITWWDFTDQNAWQGAPAGLLREDMTPKPVYEELRKLIKGKWWTHTTARADAAGEARFRGFFGSYQVSAKGAAQPLVGTFSFDKHTKGAVEVRLR